MVLTNHDSVDLSIICTMDLIRESECYMKGEEIMYRTRGVTNKTQKKGAKRKLDRGCEHVRDSITGVNFALNDISSVQVNLAIAKVQLEMACVVGEFEPERLEQLTTAHAKIKNLLSDLRDIQVELYSVSQLVKGIEDDNESD